MNQRLAVVMTVIATLSVTFIAGCGNDDSPVAAKAPAAPAPPPQVDQALVGTWYEVSSFGGIEFKSDGTWRYLYLYGNKLSEEPASYYDRDPGGRFFTTADGKCIFVWSDFGSPYVDRADTSLYAFDRHDSTMVMTFGAPDQIGQHFYVRKAIGDVVIPM